MLHESLVLCVFFFFPRLRYDFAGKSLAIDLWPPRINKKSLGSLGSTIGSSCTPIYIYFIPFWLHYLFLKQFVPLIHYFFYKSTSSQTGNNWKFFPPTNFSLYNWIISLRNEKKKKNKIQGWCTYYAFVQFLSCATYEGRTA